MMNSCRIYFTIFITSFLSFYALCDIGNLNGNVVKLIRQMSKNLQKTKNKIDRFDFEEDLISQNVYYKEYISFFSSAQTFKYNGIEPKSYYETAVKMLNDCELKSYRPNMLVKAMDNNLFATTYFGVFSIPGTSQGKIIALVGEKKNAYDKFSDWLLIDFKEQFDFIQNYSYEYYDNFCPSMLYSCDSLDLVQMKNDKLSTKHIEFFKDYAFVIIYELLGRIFL